MPLAPPWERPDLSRVVACVTGASYGVGRGVAQVLGECGATVYVTGRSTPQRPTLDPEWTVEGTAALVTEGGGRGVPVVVDHTDVRQVDDLFGRIDADEGRLDLLVSNVWQWGPTDDYEAPVWQQPVERWDAMFGVGVRSHFIVARRAIPLMLKSGRGLIVLTQERPGDDQHFGQNLVVDVAAKAMQRMVEYLAHELGGGVAAALVYLGWVRSVNRGMGFDPSSVGMTQDDFVRLTQSPHLVGRAIATLADDLDAHQRINGRTLYAGDVAAHYGFTDVDGRIPPYDSTTA